MSMYVVDASVAAKWYLAEPHADSAQHLLAPEHQLHAPDFILVELDSVFCKRIRCGDFTVKRAEGARAIVRQLPLHRHPVAPLLDSAFALANRTGCTIYDALYLALAVLLDVELVTADRRLYDRISAGPLANHIVWVEGVPPPGPEESPLG